MLSDLGRQLARLWWVVVSPKKSMASLPSSRLLPVAFLVSAYFTLGRIVRRGWDDELAAFLGSAPMALLLLLVGSVLGFWLAGVVVKFIVRILGKQLSVWKVLNIIGYSQAPRLFLSLPLSIGAALLPEDSLEGLLDPLPVPLLLIGSCIGGVLLLYSLVLLVLGLAISPDERPASPQGVAP